MDVRRSTDDVGLALAVSGARALVVGTGIHVAGSPLPDVPAAAVTVNAVGQALVERCGLAPAALHTLIDPEDLSTVGRVLTEVVRQAEDILLLYYVGHGLVSSSGELHLATRTTDDLSSGLAFRSLPYSAVRDALTDCRAPAIVVVLDCCFAGRARGSLGGAAADGFAAAQVQGSYLLAAAAGHEAAFAPPGEPHTALSGELLRLLRQGDPLAPPALTLDHVYRHLRQALHARGLPRPQRQVSGLGDRLVLSANPAHPPPLRRSRPAQASQDSAAVADDICPYRGLEVFEPEDARYFFGRERLTMELVRRLAERLPEGGPLVVIGPSGSGKSSLLRAGLIPALRAGEPPISVARTWPVLVFIPGPRPLLELAERLAGGPTRRTRHQLVENPGWLRDACREVLAVRAPAGGETVGARLVLVIDQFEQVFTAGADAAEARAFVQAVSLACHGGTDPSEAPALVVVGVRADFYAHCAAQPELVAAMEDSHLVVRPMAAGELRDTIERPARIAGLDLDDGLADVVLRDLRAGVGGPDAGALPLLSHALLTTWQRREGRLLTLAGYEATGGIWQAVARTAQSTYEGLDPAGQRIARWLLPRLVRVGEGTEDTRRRVDRAGLAAAAPRGDATAVDAVLDRFARARLLTLDRDTVEIAHEALLRAWPQLTQWIEAERTDLLVQQRVSEAADEWDRDGQDVGALYRGGRLVAATEWAERRSDQVSALVRAFLDAAARLELSEREATMRSNRRLQRSVAGLAIVLVLALGAAGTAFAQSQDALSQRQVALSRQFAAQASTVAASDPRRAMLFALAAWRAAPAGQPTQEGRSALLAAQMDDYDGVLVGHTGPVTAVAASPNGRVVATAGRDGTLRLWNAATKRQLATLLYNDTFVDTLEFSADGRTLFSASINFLSVRVWDVASRREAWNVSGPGATAIDVSRDGRLLAIAEGDKAVHLWDIGARTEVGTLTGGPAYLASIAFSPDNRFLAGGGDDSTIHLWDVTSRRSEGVLRGHTGYVAKVAFSPDGTLLASASHDGSVRLWGVAARAEVSTLTAETLQTFNTVSFSADGTTLLAAGVAVGKGLTTVRLWNVPTRLGVGSLAGASDTIEALAFSRDGHTLVGGSLDGTTTLWSWGRTAPGPDLQAISGVAFSPDGGSIATADVAGAVRVWDVRTRDEVRVLTGSAEPQGVAFSPDGRLLAAAGHDGLVRLWERASGSLLASLPIDQCPPGHTPTWPHRLSFRPDGTALSITTSEGLGDSRTIDDDPCHNAILTWDLKTAPPSVLPLGMWGPSRMAYAPGGAMLAVAVSPTPSAASGGLSGPGHVWLFRTSTGTRVADLDGGSGMINDVAFSPDGRVLAAADQDRTIRLWDVATRQRTATLTGNSSPVRVVLFSHDGRTLFSGSLDATVQVWDMATHQPVAVLNRQSDRINDLALSPDGRTLASASDDGSMALWNLDLASAQQRICRALAGPTLAGEWKQLGGGPGPLPC